MKRKILLLTFLLINSIIVVGQEQLSHYTINGVSDTSIHEFIYGREHEFNFLKEITDSTFTEFDFLTNDRANKISIKFKNDIWYIGEENKWMPFFNFNLRKGYRISILGQSYIPSFINEIKVRGNTLTQICLKPLGFKVSERSTFFIDRQKGIVAINTAASVLLIKNDYFKSVLSDKELEKFQHR